MKKGSSSKKSVWSKMRDLFAVLTVTALLFSLVPMTAFSASHNSLDRDFQIAPGHRFHPNTDTPFLHITEGAVGEFGTTEEFRLILTNAEWNIEPFNTDPDFPLDIEGFNAKCTPSNGTVTASIVSESVMKITITPDRSSLHPGDRVSFRFPLYTVIIGEGPATVRVDALDSRISNSIPYIFATAVAGASKNDADFLQAKAAEILQKGLTANQLCLDGKVLTLAIDGKEFVLSTDAGNRNVSGQIELPDRSGTLIFDIKGNGSNVKVFRVIQR